MASPSTKVPPAPSPALLQAIYRAAQYSLFHHLQTQHPNGYKRPKLVLLALPE